MYVLSLFTAISLAPPHHVTMAKNASLNLFIDFTPVDALLKTLD